jgi:DNA-binding NarL/FixJ family response regulator
MTGVSKLLSHKNVFKGNPSGGRQFMTIRILLVDDHPIVRDGLAAILNRHEDLAVIAEAASGQEAVALFRLHRPDLVLTGLPLREGAEATAAILAEYPGAVVLVLTMYPSEEGMARAQNAGAKAHLLKEDLPALLQTIRSLCASTA